MWERILKLFFIVPWRCIRCQARFFHVPMNFPITGAAPDVPKLPSTLRNKLSDSL